MNDADSGCRVCPNAGSLRLSRLRGARRLLLAKAAEGCHTRAIIEDPDGQVEPLLGIDGIEIHASRGGENYGLHRADEQMVLALHCIGVHSEPSPLILIQRRMVSDVLAVGWSRV